MMVNIYGRWPVLSDAIRWDVLCLQGIQLILVRSVRIFIVFLGRGCILDPKDDDHNPITVPCPINMDNNLLTLVVVLK
jgi:hypothetical protein